MVTVPAGLTVPLGAVPGRAALAGAAGSPEEPGAGAGWGRNFSGAPTYRLPGFSGAECAYLLPGDFLGAYLLPGEISGGYTPRRIFLERSA